MKAEEERLVRWNLACDGGWEKYHKLTEEMGSKLEKLVVDENLNIEEINSKLETILNKIKFWAFGKVSLKERKGKAKFVNADNDEDEAVRLVKHQNEIVENEVEKL